MTPKIPGYTIVKPIAQGGMASVYLAEQQSLGRRVALKLLKKFDDIYQSARFVAEGKIIASLDHRNIITLHDIGVIGEQHYISMEYLAGGDLEMRIIEGIAVEPALDLVETIGDCLEFLHRKNIVHRDIKPANILFHSDGTPVLTDFGVAKQQEDDANLTRDGTTLGSPNYISPEQAESKQVDGRSDIYSLGIVLYEMLTGAKPFQGNSDIQIIIAHISDPVPELPAELAQYQELIDRMTAKSPGERFATAGEMVRYLREIRRPGYQASTTATLPEIKNTSPGFRAVPETAATPGGQAGLRNGGMFAAGATALLLAAAIGFSSLNPSFFASAIEAFSGSDNAARDMSAEISPDEQDASSKHDEYLSKAEIARKKLRFAKPEDDSAYYYYTLILRENPQHKAALKGVEEIADIYADLVEWALEMHQEEKAREYLDTGLSVDPDNERLQKYSLSGATG
jgi:serine/threonine-protein kinase PpkA